MLLDVKADLADDASSILSLPNLANFSYLQNAANMKYFFKNMFAMADMEGSVAL